MSPIGKPPRDLLVSDNPKDFEEWLESFENYLTVIEIGKTDPLTSVQKHALALNCIGMEATKIISGLTYDKVKSPYDSLVKALKSFFIPKANLTYERYRFRRLTQEDKIMTFVNELHCVGKKCDFANDSIDSIYNQNIRDQLILGLSSDELRKRLLAENALTLDKTIHICLAHESGTEKAEIIRSTSRLPSDNSSVLSVSQYQNYTNETRRLRSPSPGRSSRRSIRFSSDIFCKYCKKSGHTIENCFKLQRKQSDTVRYTNPNKHQDPKSEKSVSALFTIEDKKGKLQKINCEFFDSKIVAMVDTGSSISLVSKKLIERLGLRSGLIKTNHSATVANGQSICFTHAISGPLVVGDIVSETLLYVTDWLPDDCLLGMDVLGKFRSLKLNDQGPDLVLAALPPLLQTFSDVFDKPIRDACYTGEVGPIITLTDDAVPYQAKQRKFSIRDENVCREHIETLVAQGVIAKASSPWRHVPVIVPKRAGGFRLAIDYRPVNRVTKLDAFPTANVNDLLQNVGGCKVFSSLDFSQFYYQIPLCESDQEKTAFSAFGELYVFTRCPFGLKNAVSLCNRVLSEVLKGIQGISVYLDDVLIHARDVAEHDEILRQVLTRIRSHNLSLNMKKCSFYQRHVSFLGFSIQDGKISPDPERTSAITQFPKPNTVRQLQRFLGMSNYFRSYVPDYASLTAELYELSKANRLNWTESGLESFYKMKTRLKDCVLALPCENDKLYLYTDASNECIGGCLMNDKNQPISFVSKKLSEVERRWSTLDKEAFAVVWSIQKLRPFLLCRTFTVYSDHKPLKYLFDANSVSAKVHRWRISVSDYDFNVQYIPGKGNTVADSLSRVNTIADVDEHCDIKLTETEIRQSQITDPETKCFYRAKLKSYTNKPAEVSDSLWSLRRQVFIKDSMLYYQDRFFIPQSMRSRIMTSIHYGHQGIEHMLQQLTKFYFWPKMKRDVRNFVANCRICSLTKPSFVSAHLKPYLLDAPMQLIAADYIGPLPADNGYRYLLVIIDAFSRFPEAFPVKDMSTETLINTFREYFSRYGFPDALLTDRGTQFQSEDFWQYLNQFQIKKLSTTAYRPSSNGICERFNGTLQRKIKAFLCERELSRFCWTRVLPTALLACRNEPHSTTGFTPSELFFSFRIKDLSLPPLGNRHIEIENHATAATNIAKRRNRASVSRYTQDRCFPEGSSVIVKSPNIRKLQLPGTVGRVIRQTSSHVVEVEMNGRKQNVSTSRVSPVPDTLENEVSNSDKEDSDSDTATPPPNTDPSYREDSPRPWRARERRLPMYLKDYDLT